MPLPPKQTRSLDCYPHAFSAVTLPQRTLWLPIEQTLPGTLLAGLRMPVKRRRRCRKNE